jgi:lauroyl/myristoyl acyltransferase/ADP-heptose:LPS heptosyltransferase
MRDYCFYFLYRAGSAFLAAFPLRALFAVGQAAGFCAWLILPKYRHLAFRNATIAFGDEKSPGQRRRLVRLHFQQLGANILSSIKIATMPFDRIEQRIKIENLDVVHGQLRAGRPVVLILSHLGNWELCAQILPKFIGYVRNSTIYQKLGNRFIDEHVRKQRGRAGVEMFDRKEGFQKAIQLLRGGGAIGILSDQHAGDQGLWVPFFGKLASTSPLPALLAKRTDATLIGVAFYTDGPARWRIVFDPTLETKKETVESITAKANELIAAQIRRAPEDWFWVHNRWKTPRPNFLLTRYKRGYYVPPQASLKPFRILIRASNWLGDSIMSSPAVRAIKRGRPDAHVTIAAPAKIAPIWKLIPEVDEIISLESNSLFATAQTLRRQPDFDAAVLFPNSLRVALETWLSDIPRRVGYRGHWRAWLLNQIVRKRGKPAPIEHQSLHYLRIAQDLGAEVNLAELSAREKTSNMQRPLGAVGSYEPEATSNIEVRGSHQPSPVHRSLGEGGTINHQILLGLCPSAEYGPAKRWFPERFAEVAAAITARKQVHWLLFGTPQDAPVGEIIAKALGDNCVNRIGQTTIEQLIDELRKCRLLLTNDTGTMHLASLLGVPTVAIFGSTEPRLTGPLGNHHIVLRHQVECSPCFLRECPIDFRCMKEVATPEVIDAVLSILG